MQVLCTSWSGFGNLTRVDSSATHTYLLYIIKFLSVFLNHTQTFNGSYTYFRTQGFRVTGRESNGKNGVLYLYATEITSFRPHNPRPPDVLFSIQNWTRNSTTIITIYIASSSNNTHSDHAYTHVGKTIHFY